MDWTKSFTISSAKPGRPVRLSGVEKTALQAAFDEHAEDGVISAFDVPLVIMDLGWSVEEFSGTDNLDECVNILKPHFLNDVITFDDFSDGFSRMITRQVLDPGFVSEGEGSGDDQGGFLAEEIADIEDDASSEGGGGFVASDEDEGGGFVASEEEGDEGGGFFVASDGGTGGIIEPIEEKPKKKKRKKNNVFVEDVPLAFSWFTKSDTINTADLRRIAKLVKDNASEKDFKDMMEVAGAVGGKIDIQAFEGLLKKL
ncbi:hypothetical protein B0I72DRAFT_132888 [Yarrowia lipolytica]|uniref:YALI0E22242p n=2 Tax=Yarrowia lipolytica TaxID=4952 RepID=Q6C502_YARLI|nr:YALI0E22242p [Yarrowia lipolytica CLIB122]AOW05784.1 hypothetical protein YALI1_E26223g [Yarrowia lipolytica]KAB8285996.1 hypothetical protein BKA91DRAFT_132519 [Yarrowia lipolytica]KAE8168768.1 hypothetical protein BKA90DRAFT_143705 [Yarrowia lipolytica]KAJ8057234.1 hypothetical protein LXG23DRAFT_53935 [Yarrowia lipolytica]QNQ00009.1 Hypothetical protein YALI2_E01324g [Yarrowia lipolytica]|eukprot:XP_504260.1 YALI0E22242p [Yarrowia lipolytica CLIB122]